MNDFKLNVIDRAGKIFTSEAIFAYLINDILIYSFFGSRRNLIYFSDTEFKEYLDKTRLYMVLKIIDVFMFSDILALISGYIKSDPYKISCDVYQDNYYSIKYDGINEYVIYYYVYEELGSICLNAPNEYEFRMSKNEFNLAMKIFFGLYNNEVINETQDTEASLELMKQKLDEVINETNTKIIVDEYGEINIRSDTDNFEIIKIHELMNTFKTYISNKDCNGAFTKENIRLIYHKDWDTYRKTKVAEEINIELGRDILIKK